MTGPRSASRRRGKDAERAIAADLHGTRTGNTGRATPDCLGTLGGHTVAVEVKRRDTLPGWLLSACRQSAANAPPGTLPIVALVCGQGPGKPLLRLALLPLDTLRLLAEGEGEGDGGRSGT